MLIACWSAKGGSGTTVVAAGLATLLGRPSSPCRLADLGGDLPSVLGLAEPPLGLTDWLASDAGPEALERLEVEVGRDLRLLPKGTAALDDGGDRLVTGLAHRRVTTVVDCGVPGASAGVAVAAEATVSLLVTRPCYLSLRKAVAAPIRPSAVVLMVDGERSLRVRDVESVLDAPVTAVVPWRQAIARAVDAGVLGQRIPGDLVRSLKGVLRDVAGAAA